MLRRALEELVERADGLAVLPRLAVGNAQVEVALVQQRALGKLIRKILQQADRLQRIVLAQQRAGPQEIRVIRPLGLGVVGQELLGVFDGPPEIRRRLSHGGVNRIRLGGGRAVVVLPGGVERVVDP